jgi:hypothetical protein
MLHAHQAQPRGKDSARFRNGQIGRRLALASGKVSHAKRVTLAGKLLSDIAGNGSICVKALSSIGSRLNDSGQRHGGTSLL